mgnify:CR=1 FL=1
MCPIEKPWCIYKGVSLFPQGIGKIEIERGFGLNLLGIKTYEKQDPDFCRFLNFLIRFYVA